MRGLFGDKRLEDFDQALERFLSLYPSSHEETVVPEEIAGDFFDSFFSSSKDEFSRVFDFASIPRERLARYEAYSEIYRGVPMIKRIIRVYKANILQKNPVTGKCLIIRPAERAKTGSVKQRSDFDEAEKFVHRTVERFQLLEKLSNKIIPLLCLYGDVFLEVVDAAAEKVDLNRQASYLSEIESLAKEVALPVNGSTDRYLERLADLLVLESASDGRLEDVVLKIHKPHNILILETDYGTRMGYVEIKQDPLIVQPDVGRSLAAVVGRISNIAPRSDRENHIGRLVHLILRKLAEKAKDGDVEGLLRGMGEEVYRFVRRMVVEEGSYQRRGSLRPMVVRFIPASRMIHFTIPSVDYAPYGGSIVDPLVLPSKLYIISQLANIINKLSRASLVRTWTIDTGSSLMHTDLIQKLRRELYNTRITLEDLSSFKSLPKLLSDFKDIFLFSKAGSKSVDVEVKSFGDPAIRVADLEDARREIIAISGIPAPYLGYMDVVELREQLVHANVSFASEIIDIQESLNIGLTRLMDILAKIQNAGFRPSEHVEVALTPPVVLILQLIEMILSTVGNIMGVFNTADVPFDPYFFLEKFCPYVDWRAFKRASEELELIRQTKQELKTPSAGAPGTWSEG